MPKPNLRHIFSDDPEMLKLIEARDQTENSLNQTELLKLMTKEKLRAEMGTKIEFLKGDKGEKGDKGDKGDSIKGDPGSNGKDGSNGLDGKDGLDGRNGRNGVDGTDGKDGNEISAVVVANKLNSLEEVLKVETIIGHKDLLKPVNTRLDEMSNTINKFGKIDQRWHGGGGKADNVTALLPITSTGGVNPVISTSMSTNKLIGRGTSGTGVMQEITLGTNLSLSGTTLNATGGSGVSSIGTINSQTKSANGGVISSSSLVFQTADATHPGLIDLSAAYTFQNFITFSQGIGLNGELLMNNNAISEVGTLEVANISGPGATSLCTALNPYADNVISLGTSSLAYEEIYAYTLYVSTLDAHNQNIQIEDGGLVINPGTDTHVALNVFPYNGGGVHGADFYNSAGSLVTYIDESGYIRTPYISTSAIQLDTSPVSGYVATSDSSGNMSWQAIPNSTPGLATVLGVSNDAGGLAISNMGGITLASDNVYNLASAAGRYGNGFIVNLNDSASAVSISTESRVLVASNSSSAFDWSNASYLNLISGAGAGAPTPQTLLALPLSTFGSGTISQLLGTPDAWHLIQSNGTQYKMPLYL